MKHNAKFCLLGILTLFMMPSANAVNIIDNTWGAGAGGFELGSFNSLTNMMVLGTGGATITGWTVGGPGDGVDWLASPNWKADTGTHALGLQRTVDSSIVTTIPTITGKVYQLTFDASASNGGLGEVSAGSLLNQIFSVPLSTTMADDIQAVAAAQKKHDDDKLAADAAYAAALNACLKRGGRFCQATASLATASAYAKVAQDEALIISAKAKTATDTYNGGKNQIYTPFLFQFTATGSSTSISFLAEPDNTLGFGPGLIIDSVSVDLVSAPAPAQVPEPSTITLLLLGAGIVSASLSTSKRKSLLG